MSLIVKFESNQYSQCSGLVGEMVSGYAANQTVSKPLYKVITYGASDVINWCANTAYRYLNDLLASVVSWEKRLKYRDHRQVLRTWVTNSAYMATATVRLIRNITTDLREFLWDAIAEIACAAHRRINTVQAQCTESQWRDEYKAAGHRLVQIITLITEVLPQCLDLTNLSDLAKAISFELEACLKYTVEQNG